jgi:transposase-like protein
MKKARRNYTAEERVAMVRRDLVEKESLSSLCEGLQHLDPDGPNLRLGRKWVAQADIVTATSDPLREQISPARGDLLLVPNGVKPDDWSTVGQ